MILGVPSFLLALANKAHSTQFNLLSQVKHWATVWHINNLKILDYGLTV